MLTDISPYGRPRDLNPIGYQPSSSVGVTRDLSRHSTLIQNMDHLGLSHSLDPSPPRPWASQVSLSHGLDCIFLYFVFFYILVDLRIVLQMSSFTDVGRGVTSLKSGTDIGRLENYEIGLSC